MEAVQDRSRSAVYRGIIRLTMPMILQNLLSTMVSSADVIMLNSVGQSAIAAVSQATQYANTLFMIFHGIGTGITMLGAQYWGKHDLHAIELIEGIALRFSLGISAMFFAGAAFAPRWMMAVFTDDPDLIALGVRYLRCVSFSYLFWGISEVYIAALRSVGRMVVSTAINVFTLGLNVLLNGVFIYGLLNVPRMGILGVALATTLSRGVELAAVCAVSGASRDVKLRFRTLFARNRVLSHDFLRMAVPALGNDMAWSIAFSVYSAIMGRLGSDMVAANSVVSVVRNFARVMCFGFANSSTIWLGKQLGAGRCTEAKQDARRYVMLTMVTAAMGGAMILVVAPWVLRFAVSFTALARTYLQQMLLINSYYVLGSALNSTLIAGVFRAGGDSRFGFLCDLIDMWAYGVPLGLVAAFVLKLPPMAVYFLLCTDEFVKWPWVIAHYRSGKWVRNITREYKEKAE